MNKHVSNKMFMQKRKHLIIGGPCSISSEEELYQTAKGIYNYIDIQFFMQWNYLINIIKNNLN